MTPSWDDLSGATKQIGPRLQPTVLRITMSGDITPQLNLEMAYFA